MDLLWNEFPLEPAPAVERLDSPRATRLQSGGASTVGGDSNELPIGVLLALAAAVAGLALVVKAPGAQVAQEHLSAGLDRLGTRRVPHLRVPRLRVPEFHLPRREVPRLHLPRLPSYRVVQQLADALDRTRQTVWRVDVLLWTSAMAAAASFGVMIAFLLGP